MLGTWRIERNAKPIRLPTRKIESLFAYLVLQPKEHSREKLATLFWGDTSDAQARLSLRVALATLRKELGKNLLFADRETVQLNPDFPLRVDAREFERALANAPQAAVDLYKGDLLADFYDGWIAPERERFHSLYIETLLRLVQEFRSRSEYKRAIEFAQKVLVSDPANERAHQHAMLCYTAMGKRDAALKQFEACKRLLQEELAVEPAPETIALYKQIKQKSAESQASQLTNLPIPLTTFVGRKQEIEKVTELLGRTRLLTLTGAGGCGKTRLAIQVATDLIDLFRDGVWWVDLSALTEASLIAQTVAKTFGLADVPKQTIIETLTNYLRSKWTLLVLDNCEHLVQGCAALAHTLLANCPNVKILTTSREILHVPGEVTWRVPSLTTPDPQHLPRFDTFAQFDALQLFHERASAVAGRPILSEDNAMVAAQICARLDGIPLAIELAASRVNVFTVEEIAARLDDRFRFLRDGSITTLPRHHTLRAAIDWSYGLLPARERALINRLSVFAGGWTLGAAEVICAGEDIAKEDVLDLTTHLIDKSLVVADARGRVTRYHMLETIWQYAREKLVANGEIEEVQEHYLEFFLRFAEVVAPRLRGAEQSLWMDWLEIEHDNLRAALTCALETAAVETGLRLAGALGLFWFRRGYLNEGSEWLARTLSANKHALTPLKANVLIQAGILAWARGGYEQAIMFGEQGLAISHELGSKGKQSLASALGHLGVVEHSQGNREKAVALLEESLSLFRELNDQWGTASTLLWLADTRMRMGDNQSARTLWLESLSLFRELGDEWGIAFALGGSGEVARRLGDYPRAQVLLEEALTLHRRMKNKLDICYSLEALAIVAAAQDQSDRATILWGAADALREATSLSLPSSYQSDYASFINQARVQLGNATFAASWDKGRALTLDQAIEYALRSE